MLRNTLVSSAIVIAGGLLASSALANTGEGVDKAHKGQQVSFEQVDQNGDGYISQSEFENADVQQVDHSTLDFDNDGRVDRTEFAAFERMETDESSQQRSQYPAEGTEGSEPQQEHDPRSSDSDY